MEKREGHRHPELMLPFGPRIDSEPVTIFLEGGAAANAEPPVRLAAAFRLYRDLKLRESLRLLRELVRDLPDNTVAQLLLGCVYAKLNQESRAQVKFLRVLRIDPRNAEATFNLSVLAEQRGETIRATDFLREYLQLRPDDTSAITHHAELLLSLGEIVEAAEMFERAARGHPPSARAINELGFAAFLKGQQQFEQGEAAAFLTWGRSFSQYSAAYYQDARLVLARREFVKRLAADGVLNKRVTEYVEKKRIGEQSAESSFGLASLVFLVKGVFPECYLEIAELDSERTRLRAALAQEGDYPYLHYRLGLIAAYQGEFSTAALELGVARDLLKGKKEEVWKASELHDFFAALARRLELVGPLDAVRFGDEKWLDAGFGTVFESESWKRLGFAPDSAKGWRAAGFSADAAFPWNQEEIAPSVALEWREVGFLAPREAKRWLRGGLTANEALRWREEFGEDVSRAIQCYRVGILDPVEATQWLRVFQLPWEAGRWKTAGFTPAEALQHRAAGISDPEQIKNH